MLPFCRNLMYQTAFQTDYTALTEDGAEWVAASSIKFVGIDYARWAACGLACHGAPLELGATQLCTAEAVTHLPAAMLHRVLECKLCSTLL